MSRKTETKSFGSVVRQSHNSKKFYSSKLFEEFELPKNVEYLENRIPEGGLNKFYCKSSEVMDEIPDSSIHLMVTSPPYNVGKEYDSDLTLDEYLSLLTAVFGEVYKKLVTGGRACINVANIGRKPYIPLHAMVIEIMLDLILVFSKDSYSKDKNQIKKDTIERDDFIEWTRSVWTFPAVNAKRIGHPAPFPVELPHRLINLYSYEGDVVLDPFCGSGTTAVAARKNNRNYICYDIKQEYIDLAKSRISNQKFI